MAFYAQQLLQPRYELGILVGGTWRQWADPTGQSYYENMSTRATQWAVPAGCEDRNSDIWTADNSKPWPQWRNGRTGRITRRNPNPPLPQTYLEKPSMQANLQAVERSPDSPEYIYRRIMVKMLGHHFAEVDGFDIYQEESRGESVDHESKPDVALLKLKARPGGSLYYYDYCLIECKKANANWSATKHQLERHCGGTNNTSKKVYAMIQVGLHVQFFTAVQGMLTATSGVLHIRNDVSQVTNMLVNMRYNRFSFL